MVSTPTTPDRPEDLDDPTGVRALLAGLPDPGPMPDHLVARIQASIAAEQQARAGTPVVSLDERRRPWRRVGLAAAAAAVAAVAVPALLTGSGPGGVLASLSGSTRGSAASSAAGTAPESAGDRAAAGSHPGSTGRAVPAGPTGPQQLGRDQAGTSADAGGGTKVYASHAAYTSKGFAAQAAAFATQPGATLAPMAAESPSIGPAGTPLGLEPCLAAVHARSATPVLADLATFDGTPAVVLVVGSGTDRKAYALPRTCTTGHTSLLGGPVEVP